MMPVPLISQFRGPETPSDMIVYVLGAIFILAATALTIAAAVKLFGAKKPSAVDVGPSPIQIRVTDEVPSRREFDDLKQKVGHIEHSLAPMERRIIDGFKEIGHDLSKKIDHLGEHEYEARGELWGKLNVTAERLAAQEAKNEVGDEIAKAITAATQGNREPFTGPR
jgi:hypothetical protein